MNRFRNFSKNTVIVLFVSVFCQCGCQPQGSFHLMEKGQLQNHYINKATKIDIPDVDVPSLPEVCDTTPPLTLDNPDPSAMWDLTLEEAIQITLKNSTVIRTLSGVGFSQAGVNGSPSALLQSPGSVRTVYDPALVESDPLYGQEAALAAFDAQLNAGTSWSKSNSNGMRNDEGEFSVGFSKYGATGTQFSLNHVNKYQFGTNNASEWTSQLVAGFSHPLLRGGSIEFNRIAGPGSSVGRYGGVAIARISTDMSLNDFEMSTRTLVADVERAYWSLYYAYHRLESVRAGREAAYKTWQFTQNHATVGTTRGRVVYLRQAEQNYWQFQQQIEVAQNNLFNADSIMRYIMGLTPSDGRLIRPIDDPITAPIRLDWENILCEALIRSPELRKQKWEVKRRELELTASKNFLLPRLDLQGSYYISGSDSDLLNGSRNNSYGSMLGSDSNGWTLGVSASAPFGWRQEIAGKRNAELNLVRAKKLLQEQESELKHQLSDSLRSISLAYKQMQTTLALYKAAQDEVIATQNAYETESTTLDQLLQAQRRKAEAETSYYNSVIDYNLAIMTLHYRKGSLLEYNNVCLTEGPWPAKAYSDAKSRARARDVGRYFNYGFTLPKAVSRKTYQQHQNGYDSMEYEELPNVLPRRDDHMLIPPAPSIMPMEIETDPLPLDSLTGIPTPVLPMPGSTTPVSFITPEAVPASTSTLTPARNMRYVQ